MDDYAMPWKRLASLSVKAGAIVFAGLAVFAKAALHGQEKRDVEARRYRWTDEARWDKP
jgi:hypothetical protein